MNRRFFLKAGILVPVTAVIAPRVFSICKIENLMPVRALPQYYDMYVFLGPTGAIYYRTFIEPISNDTTVLIGFVRVPRGVTLTNCSFNHSDNQGD